MKKIDSSDVAGFLGGVFVVLLVLALIGAIIFAFVVDPLVMLGICGIIIVFIIIMTSPRWIAGIWNFFVDVVNTSKKKYKE